MKINKTDFNGLLIIEPDIYPDDRGYFFEAYNKEKYQDFGINTEFVQDNQSVSYKNVIRGLHYQIPPFAQDKLVRVAKGKVLDVAVDIRTGSPTFGKYFSIELSENNNLQLWIPKGFAHGFVSLEDNSMLQYKCTNFYSPSHERGIIYNDEILNINWGVNNPIVSNIDKKLPQFNQINKVLFFE